VEATNRRAAFEVYLVGLWTLLQQALGRQHVFDFARADAESQRSKSAVSRRMAITAHDRHAGLGEPQLRADHVNDAARRAVQVVQGDAELTAIRLQLAKLASGHFIGQIEREGGGRRRMIHGRQRSVRPADPQAFFSKSVESLG
jgi:hypothetical protein